MDLRAELTSFFDEFVDAFRAFDGRLIARRYAAPYMAMHADESGQVFATREEIGAYFQRVVDAYREQGCRSCRYGDLDATPLGERSALATVTWDLLLESGAVLSSWRESYNLVRTANGLRIFASVDHVST